MTKDYILQEIRRTAQANGGVSLGKERFLQETGIKESDWKGKFWVRWSDAVRESGLEPNQFSTTGYDEALLMEKLIALMRELGRFPVTAEIRMKKRKDATLPNDKTFRRFGSKQQLVAKVRNYCQTRPGYEDILAICAASIANCSAQDETSAKHDEGIGFIYLLKAGRFYKIGKSNAVGRREYELAIQLPEKATTVHVIRTDDATGIEAYWHKRFESKRKNGEWFELAPKDVSAFRRRKFM